MIYRLRPTIPPPRDDEAREARIAAFGRLVLLPTISRCGRVRAAYWQRAEIRARSAEQIARMESALAARICFRSNTPNA
ncbi:hypothetical protein BM43_491 [Burkholderia gladioli]|uniref:Uncharacterized protein n=1 Tax=Burkholderia gladioli TaxID=28095 RepID=A0A095FG93_BURGA|nr:hypothetical protein [Burkholderia gladioli]AJW97689.1 hypothetical protein BM43_491 [Burkholderia gladioli]ASD80423.1 hypothetical protein CEJ98_16530 [Burkholderia gladioli pv. gladioli]AWY54337.1 hypothetical protein A8H28_24595 [Burkholderia gladioli pv. gladioli]KGC16418.1 hypothetical protein DM48_5153 [Burkholderia gladioli]PEH37393.1 hypothetical protein CRM94_22895 [Burkholderia gladioli]